VHLLRIPVTLALIDIKGSEMVLLKGSIISHTDVEALWTGHPYNLGGTLVDSSLDIDRHLFSGGIPFAYAELGKGNKPR